MAFPPATALASAPVVDVLCVGLVCVDLAFGVPHHPGPDEKLRATTRLIAPGGPAAVAAAQVTRLGGRSAFAGLIGDPITDPFAALIRTAFAAAAIDTSRLLAVPGHETPLAAILVKPDATRTVVSHRSILPTFVTNSVTNTPKSIACNESHLSEPVPNQVVFPFARVVLVDGHRPEWTAAVLAHTRASGALLVLDAGSWSDAVRTLAAAADHVVASEPCARAALGSNQDPASVAPAALRAALGVCHAATVVVTLGVRGVIWSTPDAAGTAPAFCVQPVDTTGAGDAFHGGYALGLARETSFSEILRFASAVGALACTRRGAWDSLPDASEVSALLARSPDRPATVQSLHS